MKKLLIAALLIGGCANQSHAVLIAEAIRVCEVNGGLTTIKDPRMSKMLRVPGEPSQHTFSGTVVCNNGAVFEVEVKRDAPRRAG